ncbi:hypothetical protein BD414DRAFT_553836 [Trametes punicea]|nr:hypothetical protein BD414DRAFT_553836 [Trametes punicea]
MVIMFWRIFLVLHLVLGTVELIRAECASRDDHTNCSLFRHGPSLASLTLVGLCINLTLTPARHALAELFVNLKEGVPEALQSTKAFVFAIYDFWRMPGSWLDVDELLVSSTHLYPRGHVPGAWRRRYRSATSFFDLRQGCCTTKVKSEDLHSDGENILRDSDSGIESITDDTRSRPFKSRLSPHPSVLDSMVTEAIDADTLTLRAADIALLGDYLARTRGMFAWRVFPLTALPREPYSAVPERILIQRIDAFLRPVNQAVHYVELLLEWVSSSRADFGFLVFSPRSLPTANDGLGTGKRKAIRFIGARVSAFRARKCDPLMASRAEFLLNKLGLGSQWTCSWKWDTVLAKTFDGPRYLQYALKQAVVERWSEEVRSHWLDAGRSPEEVDAWTEEVVDFGWASELDSDEEDSSWWTDDATDCSLCSNDYSETDEEWDQLSDSGTVDHQVEFSENQVSMEDTEQLAERSSSVIPSAAHRATSTLSTSHAEPDVFSEPDEVVLYPRNLSPVEDEYEDLILYRIPRAPLTVYAHEPDAAGLHVSFVQHRPVYSPVGGYAARPPPANRPQVHGCSNSSASVRSDIEALYAAYSPPSTPTPASAQLATKERQVILYRKAHAIAPISRAAGLIRLSYTLLLEHPPNAKNSTRCLISVTSKLLQGDENVPKALPRKTREAEASPDACALTMDDEATKPRKKTRRAGRKLTARRQRVRAETVQKATQLAAELKMEADAVAQDAGLVLTDIAVYVNNQAPVGREITGRRM